MAKKILIIDDTESDRKILIRFLNKAGYENIVIAENGEDGVRCDPFDQGHNSAPRSHGISPTADPHRFARGGVVAGAAMASAH